MGNVNILGHKVHPAVIGAIATVLAAVILLRARSSGAQASAGAAPAVDPFGLTTGQDQSGTITMLENQLSVLQGQLATLQTPATSPAAPAAPPQRFGLVDPTDPHHLVPVAGTLGGLPVAWLPQGTQVQLVGSPQQFTWDGKPYLAEQVDILGSKYWVNLLNLPAGVTQ